MKLCKFLIALSHGIIDNVGPEVLDRLLYDVVTHGWVAELRIAIGLLKSSVK